MARFSLFGTRCAAELTDRAEAAKSEQEWESCDSANRFERARCKKGDAVGGQEGRVSRYEDKGGSAEQRAEEHAEGAGGVECGIRRSAMLDGGELGAEGEVGGEHDGAEDAREQHRSPKPRGGHEAVGG